MIGGSGPSVDRPVDVEPAPELARPELSVVIPTLDSLGWISQVLRSHRGLLPDAEIVVVDDGSRDGTSDLLGHELAPELDLRVIRNPRRLGQWRSTVVGCLSSSSPLLLTLDDDVLVRGPSIASAVGLVGSGADVVYLHPDRLLEARWRSIGSGGFRRLARLRGFPLEYARATSARLIRAERVRDAGAVPLEVHFARQDLHVAVVDGAIEKLTTTRSRYTIPRLVAHGYMHLRPAIRAEAER